MDESFASAAKKVGELRQREKASDTVTVSGNLLWFSSRRLRRVASSTLAAKTRSLVAAPDSATSLRQFMKMILGGYCPLHIFSDCGSPVESRGAFCPNLSSKRLEIDMELSYEALDPGWVTSFSHVTSEDNYADELTKLPKDDIEDFRNQE